MKTITFGLVALVVACSSSGTGHRVADATGSAGVASAGQDQAGAAGRLAGGSANAGVGNQPNSNAGAGNRPSGNAGDQAGGGAGNQAGGGTPNSAGAGGAGQTGGAPPVTSGGAPPTPEGTIKFHDDFQGAWPGQWTLINRPGDLGNNEVGCYKPGNAAPRAGALEISTLADTSCSGYSVTSAMVQWSSYSFTYGTIEVRAKLAGGKGPWPAVWLLGANCQQTNIKSADNSGPCAWPNPGSDEIDIAEMLGSGRTSVNQQVHAATGNPGCSTSISDASKNFHSYRLVWKKGSLIWSVDGVNTCTVRDSVPSTPMFLLLNTAVGGVGGGAVDMGTLPQTSYIDEVTVWQ